MMNCTTIIVPAVTVITATRPPIRVQATYMYGEQILIMLSMTRVCIKLYAFMILCLSSLMMFTLAVTVQSLCAFTINYDLLANLKNICYLL